MVISPETVHVNVPIYQATMSKKVNIRLVSSGKGLSDKEYSFYSETKSVVITGTKDVLSNLETLDVLVSITGVTETQTRTIQITPSLAGITTVVPGSITVKITVSEQKDENDDANKNDTTSDASSSDQASSSSTVQTEQ